MSKSETTSENKIPDPVLQEKCKEMFTQISLYLKGEVELSQQDFKLLETMNKQTSEKYAEMTTMAQGLTTFMEQLQQKYREFEPYIEKIEQVDTNVTELENTVIMLDEYTKRLEEKFKKLQIQKKEVRKTKEL